MDTQDINKSVFRAYDIRGEAGTALTAQCVYQVGRALGSMAQAKGITQVALGWDGRNSSPEFRDKMSKGLRESGCDVLALGVVPSPVLYYATKKSPTNTGVMITGSHNPAHHNGIKIVLDGKTLSSTGIEEIYNKIQAQDFASGEGSESDYAMVDQYIDDIAERISLARPMKIVVDSGNGMGAVTAAKLYKKLGCEVIELFGEVDGNFPNHHPDPTVEKNMVDIIAAVKEHKADCGLAFDGDADRVGVVDNEGLIIWPDRQMMLYADDVLQRHPGKPIVFDVKCTSLLEKEIEKAGGVPTMFKTGHSIIKGKMLEIDAPLAGELSGHIFFQDGWYGFDDGVYVGARFLEMVSKRDETVHAIFQAYPDAISTPELKLEIADDKKHAFVERLKAEADFGDAKIYDIDGIRIDVGYGWALVRASNTTPCLTIRFEADTQAHLEQLQDEVRAQILKLDGTLKAPF